MSFKPKSGSFFIYEITDKEWKKDGHSYKTRVDKNGNPTNAIREDRMVLKLNQKEFAVCSYFSGQENSQTPTSFKRRSYWLKENAQYRILHYLDEALLA